MKEKLYSLFFLIFILFDPIFYSSFLVRNKMPEDSAYSSAVFFMAVLCWFLYLLLGRRYKRYDWKILGGLFLFGCWYYSTSFHYGYIHQLYWGHFLRWGTFSIGGVLLGIMLTRLKSYENIIRFIPFVVVPTTILMLPVALQASLVGQWKDDSGFNYQTLSYYFAMLYGVTVYYILFNPLKTRMVKFLKLLSIPLMFIQMACCAMSGGRGGVALLAVYVVMSLYYAKKLQILNNSKITIICVLGFLAATYVYNVFDLSHSEGLLRVINAAEDGNVTREDWTHAYPFFLKSPWFGYGPGANFYNIGFYSHGVFSDFYFENGIIGGSILLYFYIHVIRKCLKLMRVDAIYILFMLVFAYALVFNLFSGFYVSTQLNWMALGVAYGYRNKFAPKSKYNRIS